MFQRASYRKTRQPISAPYLLMCFIFQQGLILQAKETLVTLTYDTPTSYDTYWCAACFSGASYPEGDAGDPDIRYTHLLMKPTDVLHVSAGPHTLSQGDPGDPDLWYTHLLMIPTEYWCASCPSGASFPEPRRPWWPWDTCIQMLATHLCMLLMCAACFSRTSYREPRRPWWPWYCTCTSDA